jgi:hypothetical protein
VDIVLSNHGEEEKDVKDREIEKGRRRKKRVVLTWSETFDMLKLVLKFIVPITFFFLLFVLLLLFGISSYWFS